MVLADSRNSTLSLNNDRDAQTVARIIGRLRDSNLPGLRGVSVDVRHGTVTLRGRVRSFYEKQVSQQCCQTLPGILRLENEIAVASTGEFSTRAFNEFI